MFDPASIACLLFPFMCSPPKADVTILVQKAVATTTSTSTTTTTTLDELPVDWGNSWQAWWDMDEASGNRAQSGGSASGCGLTEYNGVPGSTDKVEGDRSSDHNKPDIEYFANTCTGLRMTSSESVVYGGWMQPDTWSSVMNLYMWWGQNSTGRYSLAWLDNGRIECAIANDPSTICNNGKSTVVSSGDWKHVVCLYDNGNDDLDMYIDGKFVQNTTCTTTMDTSTTTFTIGRQNTTYGWDGHTDEPGVSKVVLTASEICRWCSCGIDGWNCDCDDTTPANYKSCTTDADCRSGAAKCATTAGECRGNNEGSDPGCGSCTLPACNASAPT